MDFIEEVRLLAAEGLQYGLCYRRENGMEILFHELATIKQVREFEREMGVTLPEGFVRYLTELGNGGIGPHGIYSLNEMRRCNASAAERTDLPPMLDHSMTPEQWKAFGQRYAELDDKLLHAKNDSPEATQLADELEEMEQRLLAGDIFISTPSCTMNTLLMCKGVAKGELFSIDFDYMGSLYDEPRYGKTFEEWMITGMREAIEKAKFHVVIGTVMQSTRYTILQGVDMIEVLIDMRIKQLREEGAAEDAELAPALRDFYTRHFADNSFRAWVAIHNGNVVGTCGMSLVEKPPYFSCPTGMLGLLSSVYTEPNFRRHGIARQLVESAIRFAKLCKCGAIHITTSDAGVKLYTAMGFTQNGNFMQMKL